MKRTRGIAMFLALTLLLGACGGDDKEAASATPKEGAACNQADVTFKQSDGTELVCRLKAGTEKELIWQLNGGGGTPVTQKGDEGCNYFNFDPVKPPHDSSVGKFTNVPFNPDDLGIITNGKETGDPRFSYQWVKNNGSEIPIFAPADGVLIRIRRKTPNEKFPSNDFDMFFMVSCNTLYRFNHITSPRADIRAAYRGGEKPSQEFNADGTITEFEDLQVPLEVINVKAGEELGRTSGTPKANDFDFMVAVDSKTVCPFSVFESPAKEDLLAKLGPKKNTPDGPGVPNFPCEGYGNAP